MYYVLHKSFQFPSTSGINQILVHLFAGDVLSLFGNLTGNCRKQEATPCPVQDSFISTARPCTGVGGFFSANISVSENDSERAENSSYQIMSTSGIR